MNISFFKYQGTGNDFILLDNRQQIYNGLTQAVIARLCERRFGIGADGLMMLNPAEHYDFEMNYFNADGKPGSMCGNGGRCIVRFAYHLGIHRSCYRFIASDGAHEAEIDDGTGIINLKMQDVTAVREQNGDYILNTGSPHYIKMVDDVMDYDVFKNGTEIRYNEEFTKNGINVNFVQQKKSDEIIVRTYERGVEDETFSCGTGVTASAIVCYHNEVGYNDVTVITKGGRLVVKYDRIDDNHYTNIWLCGPAERVFEGKIETGNE
jgi:diaminopimelate epimerase